MVKSRTKKNIIIKRSRSQRKSSISRMGRTPHKRSRSRRKSYRKYSISRMGRTPIMNYNLYINYITQNRLDEVKKYIDEPTNWKIAQNVYNIIQNILYNSSEKKIYSNILNRYIPGNPIPPGYAPSPFGPIIALLGTFNQAKRYYVGMQAVNNKLVMFVLVQVLELVLVQALVQV